MSEFIDTSVRFLTLCPGGGAFDSLFCPRFLYTMIVRGGGGFAPFISCPGKVGLDEIDTCSI